MAGVTPKILYVRTRENAPIFQQPYVHVRVLMMGALAYTLYVQYGMKAGEMPIRSVLPQKIVCFALQSEIYLLLSLYYCCPILHRDLYNTPHSYFSFLTTIFFSLVN